MAALPFCHSEIRAPKPKPTAYPSTISTLGDHIRKRRLDLKLLQKQAATRIGVHELTITNWERNATVPAIRHIPAIIRFLGYDPQSSTTSLPERLAASRKALGLSQRKMAERLGVDPATIKNWEAGRHQPTGKSVDMVAGMLSDRQWK
jgi:transcriptional regulator with XRE-family HTH domain